LSSVELDLKANQEKFDKFQEKLENFQKEVRSSIHSETQKVLKTFETQTQGLRKEFSDKLEAETRRVSQVQAETSTELVAVKRQLQGLGTEFDARLDHSNTNTQVIINELTDQMQEHGSEVSVQLDRQRESFEKLTQAHTQEVNRQVEQLNAKFVEIESKLNETTNRQALALEACGVGHDADSPSVRPASDPGTIPEGTEQSSGLVGGTVSCIHQPNTGPAVASGGSILDCGIHANRNVNVALAGYSNNSELPTPLSDDASEANPILHLRRLDEFIQCRNVPKTLCLAIACRSLIGSLSKQWTEAINSSSIARLPGILNSWLSTSKQSLVDARFTKPDMIDGPV
jgi:hypothetical protein